MADTQNLSAEQQSQLEMFNEVIAHGRSKKSSIQLLQACNWNLEQAVQLHYAAPEEANAQASTSASPLLGQHDRSTDASESSGAAGGNVDSGVGGLLRRAGIFGQILQGVARIGVALFYILRTFLLGGNTPWLQDGQATGSLLRRALLSKYGADLQLPEFYSGSFSQALQDARRQAKVLVVYLHSDQSRYSQPFCTQVLANDIVREMLNNDFCFWGGDIARMEAHRVGQIVQARHYPWFCVLLPASVDDIRVIGSVQGNIEVDATIALLTSCMDEMEMHRSEIIARREQHAEDRVLREDQDKEFQESLEADRKRQEEERLEAERRKEAERLAEEQRKEEAAKVAKVEEEKAAVEDRRKRKASEIEQPGPDAQARICIRLPAGQRVERKFVSSATLADIYAWADCLSYLPEHKDRGLCVPERFTLKTSFPARELTEMDRTIQDLQLPGTVVMLTELDD